MLTEAQIEERKSYLGASEAAAVLGLSRWSSPVEVWAHKTGLLPEEDLSGELRIKVGNKLEQLVADLFMEETGKTVHRVNETKRHPKYPFIGANLDRRVVGENAVLELKTASGWKAKEWQEDEFPAEYVIQVIHQMAVTGAQKGYLAVLIGGNQDFKWKPIDRNEKVIGDLIRREVEFWEKFVIPKVMPSVTERDKDALGSLFPDAIQGKEIALDDRAANICELLEGMHKDAKALTAQILQQENELRALLKDADRGIVGPWTVRWANMPAWEGVVKKKAYRRLTVKRKNKEEE